MKDGIAYLMNLFGLKHKLLKMKKELKYVLIVVDLLSLILQIR